MPAVRRFKPKGVRSSVVGLLDGIDQARRNAGRVVFLGPDSTDDDLGWSEFFDEAERLAAWLQQAQGIGPGSRVVVLAMPSRAMVTAVVAVWMAGAGVTCAPTPARTVGLARYVKQTRDRITALGDALLLLGAPYEELGPELGGAGNAVYRLADATTAAVAEPLGAWKPPDLTPADTAVLQFTSGTTADPRIVRISHANLAANITSIKERIRHDEVHGRLLTWLPLSHDMGLIGALAVQVTCGQCDVLFGTPADYLASPSSWLANASRYRATVLMGPGSAYAMAGRLLALGPKLDLSSVKVALCGGEPIEPAAIERFLDAAAEHGLDRDVFLPAYGLAEATLAVAMPSAPGLRVDEVDADVLTTGQTAVPVVPGDGRRSRRLVRLGAAVPGVQLRVVDPRTEQKHPDRAVGEIQVHGASVTDQLGLRAGGWLATGDLGYLVDDELVVCGRSKDLIIIGGRNLHPEEIEQAAARVPGVRPGNVVAFPSTRSDSASTEGVSIALEAAPGRAEAAIRVEVVGTVLATVGVRPVDVHVLPPGSIPKTPSGKLQRSLAAERFGGGR